MPSIFLHSSASFWKIPTPFSKGKLNFIHWCFPSHLQESLGFSHLFNFFYIYVCVCVCVCAMSWSVMPKSVIPWTITCQTALSMEFSRQESWSELPFPSPGNLSNPETKFTSSATFALAGRFFTTEPPGTSIIWIISMRCSDLLTIGPLTVY